MVCYFFYKANVMSLTLLWYALLLNLLVRIYLIVVMIWWTGLAPWEFEFPFPGILTSTFLCRYGFDNAFSAQPLYDDGYQVRTTVLQECAAVPRRARI